MATCGSRRACCCKLAEEGKTFADFDKEKEEDDPASRAALAAGLRLHDRLPGC